MKAANKVGVAGAARPEQGGLAPNGARAFKKMAQTLLCRTRRHDRCPGKVVSIGGWILGDCECECHKAGEVKA
jgi:hypothetical protein